MLNITGISNVKVTYKEDFLMKKGMRNNMQLCSIKDTKLVERNIPESSRHTSSFSRNTEMEEEAAKSWLRFGLCFQILSNSQGIERA